MTSKDASSTRRIYGFILKKQDGGCVYPPRNYSTVTDFARFLGLSTSVPRMTAV